MIISMKLHATRQEIDEVTDQVKRFGYKVHSIEGEERVVIGVVGVGDVTACLESVEAMPQVEAVTRITAPYKFVSKEFRKEKTRIRVNGTEIGGNEFVMMAGPCSVEREEQIMRAAEGVAKAGAKLLRADFIYRNYEPAEVRQRWRQVRAGQHVPGGHAANFERGIL